VNDDGELDRIGSGWKDVSYDELKRIWAALGIKATPKTGWRWEEGFLQYCLCRMLKKRGRIDCLKPL
jgi:hypothetical protein